MCMDLTETYDDMIGLRLLLYMCKAEKSHKVTELKLGGYEFKEQLQTCGWLVRSMVLGSF